MTITQTVEIPADRRITFEVPREVPIGKVILTFTPEGNLGSDEPRRQVPASNITQTEFEESITEKLNNYYRNHNSCLDDDLKTASYRLLSEVDW